MIKIEEYGFPKRTAINWANVLLDEEQRNGYKPLVVVIFEEMALLVKYMKYIESPSQYKKKHKNEVETIDFFSFLDCVTEELYTLIRERNIKDNDIFNLTKNSDVEKVIKKLYGENVKTPMFPNVGEKRYYKRRDPQRDKLRKEQPLYTFIRGVLFISKKISNM